jgi:hypothetical protein
LGISEWSVRRILHIDLKRRLQTNDKLKDAIRHKITAITEVMTRRALQNFRVRLQECIAHESRHLDDIIFITK